MNPPNHPNNYVDSLLNAYILNAQSPSGRVKLHISKFNTEPCCDKLLVLDRSNGPALDV